MIVIVIKVSTMVAMIEMVIMIMMITAAPVALHLVGIRMRSGLSTGPRGADATLLRGAIAPRPRNTVDPQRTIPRP